MPIDKLAYLQEHLEVVVSFDDLKAILEFFETHNSPVKLEIQKDEISGKWLIKLKDY